MDNSKKDSGEFNKSFEEYIQQQKQKDRTIKTEEGNDGTKSLKELTFTDIVIGLKDTWLGIINDIINRNISFDMIKKENRLFYIGLTIIILTFILFILTELE